MSDLSNALYEFVEYSLKHTTLKSHKDFGEMARDLIRLVEQNDKERAEEKRLVFSRLGLVTYLYRQLKNVSLGKTPDFVEINTHMVMADINIDLIEEVK